MKTALTKRQPTLYAFPFWPAYILSMVLSELEHIIKRCIKNDRLAQEKLYRAYFKLFCTIAMDYTKDNETVLAIVNETFLKIFLNLHGFNATEGTFEQWGKRILKNVCIDHYRKKRTLPAITELGLLAEMNCEPMSLPVAAGSDIEYYFNHLPGITKKVCKLYLIQGYSHEEVGEILGISKISSRWHLFEGKKKLKEILKDKRNG